MFERVRLGSRVTLGATAGVAATVIWLAATGVAVSRGAETLAIVGTAAYLSMAVAAAAGARVPERNPTVLVWGYGVAAGAMVTSASVFLLPQALGQDVRFGGLGVAIGLLTGYAAHVLGHRLSHLDLPGDRTIVALTAHATAAGVVIGVIYGTIQPGVVLGLAIVSHKGPAGYAAATRYDGDWRAVLVPAAALGIAGVAASTVALPVNAPARGVVFGFATGVFVHVAMDFLPRCEIGSEIHEAIDDAGHATLDRLRLQAVGATALGAAVVVAAWLLLA